MVEQYNFQHTSSPKAKFGKCCFVWIIRLEGL